MKTFENLLVLAARGLLCVIFIFAGIGHLTNWEGTLEIMRKHGMALERLVGSESNLAVNFFLGAAVFLMLCGGISVLTGLYAKVGAAMIILFLVTASCIFHNFWTFAPDSNEFKMQMGNFMKNFGLVGGMLLIIAHDSGDFSLDRCLCCWKKSGE
jgi:putative oxidoreductase